MNYYLRYFDNETLVHTIEEAIEFLDSIDEIELTDDLVADLTEYAKSDLMFPKRYKVRARIYFIVIKTEAATMQDFKDKKALRSMSGDAGNKNLEQQRLSEEREGWYEGSLNFKKVVVNHIGKCEYRDTMFTARVKATSPGDCYNRIVEHLQERVDKRSQFPSAKGKNFNYTFLGLCK